MKHELKIWPQHWHRVNQGSKPFEIRENDRGFQKGDEVVLRAWDPKTMKYIGSKGSDVFWDLARTIGDVYPIDEKRVVFGLLPRLPIGKPQTDSK